MNLREAQSTAASYTDNPYYLSDYRPMERLYLPSLFRLLKGVEPCRVLEIGPGWGTTAIWLSDRGHATTVMDLVPSGTFMSEQMLDDYGIAYIQNDIEDQAVPSHTDPGTFDIVIMTQVIHHLAWRPDRALQHASSLMATEGRFITSVLDRRRYRNLDTAYGDDWRDVPQWGDGTKSTEVVKCMYTKATFESLLRTVFDDVRVWRPLLPSVIFGDAGKR